MPRVSAKIARRVHEIKIVTKYEGPPICQEALDDLHVDIGDLFCVYLRDRYEDADQIYVSGMNQTLDVEDTK